MAGLLVTADAAAVAAAFASSGVSGRRPHRRRPHRRRPADRRRGDGADRRRPSPGPAPVRPAGGAAGHLGSDDRRHRRGRGAGPAPARPGAADHRLLPDDRIGPGPRGDRTDRGQHRGRPGPTGRPTATDRPGDRPAAHRRADRAGGGPQPRLRRRRGVGGHADGPDRSGHRRGRPGRPEPGRSRPPVPVGPRDLPRHTRAPRPGSGARPRPAVVGAATTPPPARRPLVPVAVEAHDRHRGVGHPPGSSRTGHRRGRRRAADPQRPRGDLPPGPGRHGRAAVRHVQAADRPVGPRGGRRDLVGRPVDPSPVCPIPQGQLARRAPPALERPQGRHEPRGASTGAPLLLRRLRRIDPRIPRSAPRPGRHHRTGPGP